MSAATFKRINSVVVEPTRSQVNDLFLHPQFAVGSYTGNVAPENNVLASSSAMFRGQPAGYDSATGTLVPPNASGASFAGFLVHDVTAYVVAKGTKVAIIKSGRVRTYAGATITPGAAVKADTSADFIGVVPWVDGTDSAALRLGRVYPIDDGSASHTGGSGPTPATSIAKGDTVFLTLDNN